MEAVRRLFSVQRQFRAVDSALQYQGMASDIRQRLDVASKYEMNSGCKIPVLGYGVCALLTCLVLLCLSLVVCFHFGLSIAPNARYAVISAFQGQDIYMSVVILVADWTPQQADKFVLLLQVYQT